MKPQKYYAFADAEFKTCLNMMSECIFCRKKTPLTGDRFWLADPTTVRQAVRPLESWSAEFWKDVRLEKTNNQKSHFYTNALTDQLVACMPEGQPSYANGVRFFALYIRLCQQHGFPKPLMLQVIWKKENVLRHTLFMGAEGRFRRISGEEPSGGRALRACIH